MSSGRRRPTAGDIETVDLTLSPSPEPRPRPLPQQQSHTRQQRLPTYFKREGGTPIEEATTPGRPNGASSSGSRSHLANSTPLPTVSTDHLRQIINTSSFQQVRDLLLELCQSSPALSGAVARGLAPHSTWAQNTIRDYERRNGLSQVKSEPNRSLSESSSRRTNDNHGYAQPRSPGHANFEIDTLEGDSLDSLSDLEELPTLPSHSSSVPERNVARPSSSNYRATSSRTPTSQAPPNDGQPSLSVRVKSEAKPTPSMCIQCSKIIQPGTSCYYHAGRKKIERRGSQRFESWICCGRPLNSVGCCKDDHIPMSNSSIGDAFTPTESKKPRLA